MGKLDHMQKETRSGEWLEIRGDVGSTWVSTEVVTCREVARLQRGDLTAVAHYYAGDRIYEVHLVYGLLSRWSSPGYLDCTEWEPIRVSARPMRVFKRRKQQASGEWAADDEMGVELE